MPTPSILLIPDRYKAAVLYSQIPDSGAVDFDVTRATTAYRTNASGVLESVASGVPRLDYPAAGGCPALLVEPAATNLVLRSEEFDNAYWTKEPSVQVVSEPSVINPRGVGSSKLEFISGGTRRISRAIDYVSGTTYTASIYAKSDGVCNLRIRLSDDSAPFTGINAEFNLINGTVISSDTNLTARIFPAANGFFRCSVTATATSSVTRNLGFWLLNATTAGDGIFIDAAQLETGSVATSYIPTVVATATRNADVISKTGVSGFIGQTQGTLYAELDATNFVQFGRYLTIHDGTTNNSIELRSDPSKQLQATIISSAVTVFNAIRSGSPLLNGQNKLALAYDLNNVAFYVNGTLVGSSTSVVPTSVTLSSINIGSRASGGSPMNDRIRAAAIYPTRLSNAELAALTTL
jgi:hypothetical protein